MFLTEKWRPPGGRPPLFLFCSQSEAPDGASAYKQEAGLFGIFVSGRFEASAWGRSPFVHGNGFHGADSFVDACQGRVL
jgi:hypothetical protein